MIAGIGVDLEGNVASDNGNFLTLDSIEELLPDMVAFFAIFFHGLGSPFGDEGGILVAELELAGKDLAENFVLGIALAAAATIG